jgi:hypothetical protein
VDGDLEVSLDLGGSGGGDGIRGLGRQLNDGAFLGRGGRCAGRVRIRDGYLFVAIGAFNFLAGSGSIHFEFLAAIGAIEDEIHKRVWFTGFSNWVLNPE